MNLLEEWSNIEIIDEIGGGAFGTVYEAEDTSTNESCAIKIIQIPTDKKELDYLKRSYLGTVGNYVESMARQCYEEIHVLTVLNQCKHIVHIKDSLIKPMEDGISWRIYIKMDLLDDLSEIIFDEDKVIQLGIDICDALVSCEKYGIIHRDIKPDNILVDCHGHFCLSDFGEAKQSDMGGASSIKGTFSYMAPELYKGEKYDQRVDIYSLGLIMYQKVNHGREPFVPLDKQLVYFQDREKALNRRMNGEILPAPVDASPELVEIILKACAFSMDQRYKGALEMKEDLWQLKLGTYKLKNKRSSGKKQVLSYEHKQLIKRSVGITIAIVAVILTGFIGGWQLYNHLYFTGKNLPEGTKVNRAGVIRTDGSYTIPYICELLNNLEVNQVKKVVITVPVNEIADGMFRNCKNLQEIEMEDVDQVKVIGREAFYNCEKLKDTPKWTALEYVGDSAFYHCTDLKQIYLPDTLVEIGAWAYYGCEAVEEVYIPEGIQSIMDYTFSDCIALEEVNLPSSLIYIYDYAFGGCKNLSSVNYPEGKNVVLEKETAFLGCDYLAAKS